MINKNIKKIIALTMGVSLSSGFIINNSVMAYSMQNGQTLDVKSKSKIDKVEKDGIIYQLKNGSYTVIGYEGEISNVEIPSQIN